MKKLLLPILSLGSLLVLTSAPVGAVTIIDTFDSDLNTGAAFIGLSSASSVSSGLYPSGDPGFKNLSAFNPSLNAPTNFTGPAPYQAGAYMNFVGASALNSLNSFVASRLVSSSSVLEMTFGSVDAGTGETSVNAGALYLINKASFQNGLNTGTVSFSSTDTLTINVARFDAGLANGAVRFVVQDGASYYVSQATRTTTGSFSIANPNAANWALYDPSTNMNFNSGATFAPHSFANVLAVGVLYDNDNYTSTVASTVLRMNNFEVTAIPEPSTYAAFLIGGICMLVAMRRRRVA